MSDVIRSIKEGLLFGLIAGAIYGIAYVTASAIAGDPAIFAFRRLASVLLGQAALVQTPTATVIVIGLIGHLYLSAMFGLIYGLYNSALTMDTRQSLARQAVIGPLYGVMLWLVNFHVFATYRYPWLLEGSQGTQAVLHAVFYGLPLGLLYATAEIRAGSTRAVTAHRSARFQIR